MNIYNSSLTTTPEAISNGVRQITPAEAAVGFFRAYISPIIFIFGLMGNISALDIFSKQKQRNRFQIYSLALAISDSLVLIFNTFLDDFFGRGLLYASNYKTIIKIDTMSTFSCKLMEYVSPTFVFNSGYLLVAFSADRALTVLLPVKFQSGRYIRGSIIICIAITVSGMLIALPLAVNYGISYLPSAGYYKCDPVFDENSNSFNIADFSLYFTAIISYAIPAVLIIVFSIIILYKLHRIRQARKTLLSDQTDNKSEMGRVVAHLLISSLSLFFTFPLLVIIPMRIRARQQDMPSDYQNMLAHVSRFLSSFKDFNYAVNGYLYMANFPFYRKEVLKRISCGMFPRSSKVAGINSTV